MINESELNTDILLENKQQVNFTMAFFRTIFNVKQNKNVDDIYLNLSSEKMEIYIFLNEESFDDEMFVSEQFTNFEKEVLYFPEIFIYLNNEVDKMNVLPRKVLKIC